MSQSHQSNAWPHRQQLATTAQALREEEARSVAAEQVSRAAEAATARQGAALDAARRDATDAHAEAVHNKGSLEASQRQLASQAADHHRHAQVGRTQLKCGLSASAELRNAARKG